MKITALGHAGLLLESQGSSVVCDPWFSPAFFGSWFPYPNNDHLPPAIPVRPSYLYISHLHRDHFDPAFLERHFDKSTPVLLPAHPLPLLENRLRAVGFTTFVQTEHNVPLRLGPLTVMITSLAEPSDGAIGDSSLLVDDGEVRILNLNDARPIELEPLMALGSIDALFLQYSGAIWYPMVYDFPAKAKEAWGRKKRVGAMARALRYVEGLNPKYVIPSAGPACFLDPDLYELNDFDDQPWNTFPSANIFLDYLRDNGREGQLMLPGSVGELSASEFRVGHQISDAEITRLFSHKREYLTAYQQRYWAEILAERESWREGRLDVFAALQALLDPLLDEADHICAAINDVVLLQVGDVPIAVDFAQRRTRLWRGEPWVYRFTLPRPLVEACLLEGVEDWTNELFLSFRFAASRRGPYNQHIFIFFRCLTRERLQYAEGRLSELGPTPEVWEAGGYRMPRRCPHAKGDLARFGVIEDGVLTCRVHNWQFELASGRCLTADGYHLNAVALQPPEGRCAGSSEGSGGPWEESTSVPKAASDAVGSQGPEVADGAVKGPP